MTGVGADGTLVAEIWPTHVGLTCGDPGDTVTALGEPILSVDYKRGQISWTVMPNGEIVGAATIPVPPGDYTHMAYFYHPEQPSMCGKVQLEFPLRVLNACSIRIDPIVYGVWKNPEREACRPVIVTQ